MLLGLGICRLYHDSLHNRFPQRWQLRHRYDHYRENLVRNDSQSNACLYQHVLMPYERLCRTSQDHHH